MRIIHEIFQEYLNKSYTQIIIDGTGVFLKHLLNVKPKGLFNMCVINDTDDAYTQPFMHQIVDRFICH